MCVCVLEMAALSVSSSSSSAVLSSSSSSTHHHFKNKLSSSSFRLCFPSSLPPPPLRLFAAPKSFLHVFATASNASTFLYAKEMERIAAKEALLLAIKDAAGVDALISGSTSDTGRIDVNERIIGLERLNPTPRPTTSPLLEGLWQFKWIGSQNPGQLATRVLLQRFPSAVATLTELTLLILNGSAKATASLKLFNTITSSVTLTSKLTTEGPLRLKEEYVEGELSTPIVQEGTIPMQVQNAYDQFLNAIQRLPDSLKDTLSNGVKISLAGTFERQILISYLDEEILIARDTSGVPEVLFHLTSNATVVESVPEYVS